MRLVVIVVFLFASSALGQQIDLSTLPPRDAVQLTIYNSEDITLVRELRHVTVKKGSNELQFSWANTLIDPTSVSIEFRDHTKELDVVDTRFPHDRPQVLYWNVASKFDGDALVEISYFTSGLSWSADYVGIVDQDESSMRFDGYVTITNESGEDFENAQVRMVVGEINLVEKIAELAANGMAELGQMPAQAMRDWFNKSKAEMPPPPAPSGGIGGGGGNIFGDPGEAPEIVKEGLSEYFIFTVQGTQTIKNAWSQRLRLFTVAQGRGSVPMRVVYRYRPYEYGDELVRLFLVRNDEASGLGTTPLPDGEVRLFREQAKGASGLSVVAFVPTKYVPIGQEFEFNVGRDPQVILEHIHKRTWRDEFWFQRGNNDRKLWSPDKGEKIEPNDQVVGWTTHLANIERLRNYREKPIEVEFRFAVDGDVTFTSALNPTLFDFHTVDFKTSVKAGETKELGYEVARREGTNAKQERIALEDAK